MQITKTQTLLPKRLVRLLSSRTEISIPRLQHHLAVDYRRAAGLVQMMQKTHILALQARGNSYQVNPRCFEVREMTLDEGKALLLALPSGSVSLLSRIAETPPPVGEVDVQQAQALTEKGLIYEFDGYYLSTVPAETASAVWRSLRRELMSVKRRDGDSAEAIRRHFMRYSAAPRSTEGLGELDPPPDADGDGEE